METVSIKIGSRGSPLAKAMADEVKKSLMRAHNLPEESIILKAITTTGDRITDRALSEAGGKGLFTKEIEEALSAGDIDIAVHSTKDMPTILPDGLYLSAFMEREDPRDAFIGRNVKNFYDLPHGATIGSAALRRVALVRKLRPDLKVVLYRGNIETRLRKLQEGEVDGTFLAMAGLKRLGLEHVISEIMSPNLFIPAPGQGAIGLETRVGDMKTEALIAPLRHLETMQALECERAFLRALDGSCRTPIAGFAEVHGEALSFHGLILSPDGSRFYEIKSKGLCGDSAQIGMQAAEKLRRDAGEDFFRDWL